ncbi:hypothetical protein AVEN_247701-1 [Araneus ventricosus]|uniref:Uncharacterized protein n=1 Tax=Araneus ventricosus TaxID=182803 RepID=A0A4Y2GLN3_ARAVE|nr:hypothetical protein AVEN_247701-1 [Araneus ventricosus]
MPLKVEKNKLTVATLDIAQMRNAAPILESEALVTSARKVKSGFNGRFITNSLVGKLESSTQGEYKSDGRNNDLRDHTAQILTYSH